MLRRILIGSAASGAAAAALASLPKRLRTEEAKPDSPKTIASEASPKLAPRSAICMIIPSANSSVRGVVSFYQESPADSTKIVANVWGLNPNSLHGFHIHEWGDLTKGCDSAGPHFNPHGKSHGAPSSPERHVGDLGNIKTNERGAGFISTTDQLISLFGDYSVVGRSVVIHEGEDDLGRGASEASKTTGNSGGRLGCGVIGLSAEFKNLPPQ